MQGVSGDNSAGSRIRIMITVFLALLEVVTIAMTAWFAHEMKSGRTKEYEAVSAYARSMSEYDGNPESKATTVLVYCVGVETVTVLMFSAAVYFQHKFCSERVIRRKKEELNDRLKEAEEAAREASLSKSRFLSGMSHEIRTPINAIMGTTQLAMINIHDEERLKYCLHTIDRASRHLLLLVNDVLDMGRIESGKVVINHNRFNISDVLCNCVSMTKGQLQDRNIDFVCKFDDFTYSDLIGDELHLSQILINILANAVKFTPDGGKIIFRAREMSLEKGHPDFIFEIEDTGIGMTPEFLNNIWEPYAQEGRRTDVREGTGLGLAIVKKYVDMMDGSIGVESRPGMGSRFTVKIPFEVNVVNSGESDTGDDATQLNGMKVLLVEDNELNKEVARTILETQGINVDTADNGQTAVDIFIESKPFYYDAILMDVMMPVMDGITASGRIRSSGREDAGTTPIIAMTANAFDEDVRQAKEAGMNEHVAKPIDFYRLFRTLAKYRRTSLHT